MKKITYRSTPIQSVTADSVVRLLAGATALVLAFDIAKTKMMFGIATALGKTLQIVRFDHPTETRRVLSLIDDLRARGISIEAVMEPTGTYGTVLRHHIVLRGVPVFMLDPKRSHDASLVFDGVPSMHDAKACTILARLHAEKLAKKWEPRDTAARHARKIADQHRLAMRPYEQLRGELEARVVEVWPELQPLMGDNVSWPLRLLSEFGTPSAVCANKEAAEQLLVRTRGMKKERIAEILASAEESLGVPIDAEELALLKMVAEQMLVLRKGMRAANEAAVALVESASSPDSLRYVAGALGAMTACVVFGDVGDPSKFASAPAFEKALGLNLKIRSSGETKGQLRITKRGPGRARKYLFLAALRLIHHDGVVRAWYERRCPDEGSKLRAVVAVMRKLARALVHVARGKPFDATKLFDTKRLGLLPKPETAVDAAALPAEPSLATLSA